MPRRKLAAVVALVALVTAPAAVGSAGEREGVGSGGGERFGIRLVDVPSDQADDPRARQYVVDHVAPGETIERDLEVSNDTGDGLAVSLYTAAAVVDDGEFRFGEGRARNELSAWATVTPPELTLAPGERSPATVTVAVPDDASPGERYGVVWAEVAGDRSGDIQQVNRVGVRIYLSVGEGGEPPTDFEIVSLTAARDDQGTPLVRVAVDNTGARALDVSGELTLDDGPGGLSAGPFPFDVGTTIAPGDSADATVTLDPALPDGPWHATALVRSGTIERRGEAVLTFPAQAGTSATRVEASPPSSDNSALPWGRAALAIAVAVFTLGGLALVLTRRLRGT